MSCISKSLKSYLRAVEGSMTLLGLYIFGAMIIIAVLALDVSNLLAVRTQLQAAADFAAHAALYQRQFTDDPDLAKAQALQMVKNVYPTSRFGEMLKAEDLHFGYYNQTTGAFQVDETSKSASAAFTGRNTANNNKVAGYLSRMIGYDSWDVATAGVFVTGRNKCLRDGWVGEDVVDAQSNNVFIDGYCIHSNTQVHFNSNNSFECGPEYLYDVTVSSRYGEDGISLPASGLDTNDGLDCAIDKTSVIIPLVILSDPWLNKIHEEVFDEVLDSDFHRWYLTVDDKNNPIELPNKNMTSTQIHALRDAAVIGGHYFTYSNCSGPNSKLTIDASAEDLREVMIETACKVVFANSSKLADVTLWVTNTIDKSVTSAQDLILGDNDHCAPGGGVNIVTYGGFEVPQGLEMFGSQVLARGPIQFAAGPQGEGGSLISGSTIDGTSNGSAWGACLNNLGEVFEAEEMHLAG